MYTRVDTTPNHMHMQSGMRTLKCVHAHVCTHNTHVHTHRRTHAYVCSHTCTNTYAHSHALVCTQSRMHQPHTCPHPPAASHTGTLRHTGAHPPLCPPHTFTDWATEAPCKEVTPWGQEAGSWPLADSIGVMSKSLPPTPAPSQCLCPHLESSTGFHEARDPVPSCSQLQAIGSLKVLEETEGGVGMGS